MEIEVYRRGIYQVIKIKEELSVIADLSELQFLVEGYIKQGRTHICVGFTDASYFYSGAVGVLVSIIKRFSNGENEFCIIEPNSELKRVFSLLNIDQLLKIYDSEEDLPKE